MTFRRRWRSSRKSDLATVMQIGGRACRVRPFSLDGVGEAGQDRRMRSVLICLWFCLAAGAAAACPDPRIQAVETYEASGRMLDAPRSFAVIAGGSHNVVTCPEVRPRTDSGEGFFTTQADFAFDLSGLAGRRLVIGVMSECDASLLVNTGSGGWYFDDDDNGNLDPRIVLTQPSDGLVQIWVGTYDGGYCAARLTLDAPRR